MIKPLGQRVLLEKIKEEKTTMSGIVLPDTATEEKNYAKVVSLGTGKKLEDGTRASFDVKEGDKVLYSKFGGTEAKFEGKNYIIVDEKDILAIIG